MNTITIGQLLARRLFERKGNHSEIHLSEIELAAAIDGGIELAIKAAMLKQN